jgi:putative ABC transport system ATP-binding protein
MGGPLPRANTVANTLASASFVEPGSTGYSPADPREQSSVRLHAVSKTYREGAIETSALKHVSLSVPANSFTMLVGRSGSGKTTLLNIIGCIDQPSSGTVTIDGESIEAKSDYELTDFRARKIGFIFQNFNLVPVLTAYENVDLGLHRSSLGGKQRRAAVTEALDAVGLADRANHRPAQLSGGQKQRAAIARALVKRPAIVLADEPTANLDSETGAEIIALMRNMQRATGAAFVFSTHDKELIRQADHLFVLKDGMLERRSSVDGGAHS